MPVSQVLSEKAIKKLGLDKEREENPLSKEVERRIATMTEEEKRSIPENELRHKVYYEVWDGSGIEGWWD